MHMRLCAHVKQMSVLFVLLVDYEQEPWMHDFGSMFFQQQGAIWASVPCLHVTCSDRIETFEKVLLCVLVSLNQKFIIARRWPWPWSWLWDRHRCLLCGRLCLDMLVVAHGACKFLSNVQNQRKHTRDIMRLFTCQDGRIMNSCAFFCVQKESFCVVCDMPFPETQRRIDKELMEKWVESWMSICIRIHIHTYIHICECMLLYTRLYVYMCEGTYIHG